MHSLVRLRTSERDTRTQLQLPSLRRCLLLACRRRVQGLMSCANEPPLSQLHCKGVRVSQRAAYRDGVGCDGAGEEDRQVRESTCACLHSEPTISGGKHGLSTRCCHHAAPATPRAPHIASLTHLVAGHAAARPPAAGKKPPGPAPSRPLPPRPDGPPPRPRPPPRMPRVETPLAETGSVVQW